MKIDVTTALRIGLVQEIVPAGTALARAKALAERIAEYPQLSLRADREGAIRLDGIEAERVRGEATISSDEMTEGLERFLSGDRPAPPEAS